MADMTSMPRASRGLTRADLESFPDDGWRYELLDGTLLVTPAPSFRHQRASLVFASLLDRWCPSDLVVLTAPFAVFLTDDTELQPDLLVAPRAQFDDKDLPGAPLLAVEILSPSTRLIDLNLKRARYEQAGCPSYWVLDPVDPRLTAWELVDGAYVQAADVAGADSWTATAPYAVTIRPHDLVD